ncbi:MAG: sodium:proton antiporter [Betaproteobacteria bacterium]|nr:sodium:proton antiporter [Betaproteobacteria bacterium]
MPHEIHLISTIAAAFGFSMLLGLLAARLKLPPLLGYLLAGIMIGPFTPGFVGDLGLAAQLAEIGVMLLMFGVGLHFSLADLMKVKSIAIPGAMFQIIVAVGLGALAAIAWGWEIQSALVFGLCLSVASTVVLLRALEARGQLQSVNGQLAIGWLIVEDLVMVLILVLLPALASMNQASAGLMETLAWLVIKLAAFVAVMLLIGKRLLPRLLWWIAETGSQELFRLGVIAVAIGVAFGAAKLFDVSFALGAFFAGMMLRESDLSHRAAEESLPLRDAFAVLFFVPVGMLFDPAVLWQHPLKLLIVVMIIVLGKTVAALGLVLLFRYPLSTALTVAAGLAQIGEFSFILAGLGLSLGLITKEAQDLILAGALFSIALNTALFKFIEPMRKLILERSSAARKLEHRLDDLDELPQGTDRVLLAGQVVLLGYGRVGRRIAIALREKSIAMVIVDQNKSVIESLREQGFAAVLGDGSTPEVLIQAHIAQAAMLVLAVDDPVVTQRAANLALEIQPKLSIVIRAHSEEEAEHYNQTGTGLALVPEISLADQMAEQVLLRYPLSRQSALSV